MHIGIAQRSTHIITLFGSIFCILGIVTCALVFSAVEKHKARLTEVRTLSMHIEENKGILASLVKRLEETAEARTSLKGRILSENGVVDLLTLIETIAKEQQVKLTTEGIVAEPLNDDYASLVLSVRTEGSYDALLKLLTIFEQLPYQAVIHSVQFSHTEGDTDFWVSTYKIQITTVAKHAL